MTFDETIAKVGTYLKNNYLSNSEDNDRFFYIILNDLRQEYAPTVEMTKQQRDIIIRLFDDSDIGRDAWDNMINDDSPELPEISYRQAIMAYMNPETIKVVGN